MGEIFKAQDTRLNRFVAIKVLSTANSGDPERRRRFVQEAQAASALNHPNIITIHDIVSEGDNEFMVMEYVSGKTLVDLIPKGGLRMPQALKYAVQMTDALSIAHAAGIIHRDLKPANVMVTDSGLVKILDFGLAKLTDRGPMSQVGDNTQTIADAPLTVEGSIIGTVSYMSPEQAQGKKVDTRSDIFSFGVVLYEMVSGVRAFGGDNALSTLSAILRDEAKPMTEVAPDVPAQIEQLIHRCLRKEPDQRWQSMQDVRMALGALKHESDSGQLYKPRIEGGSKSKSPMPMIGLVAGLVVLAGGGAGSWWWIKKHKAVPPPVEVPVAAVPVAAPPPPAPVVETPPAAAPAEPPAEVALTNDHIIELVQNKVPPSVILSQIRAANKTNFNLSSTEIIKLSKAGVPATVIEVMRNPKAPPVAAQTTTKSATTTASSTPNTSGPSGTSAPVIPATSTAPPPVAVAPPPQPAPVPHTATEKIVVVSVTDGSPMRIKLSEDIASDAQEGQALRFVIAEDFRAGDVVVVAKGAAVTGAIVDGAKKKFLGIGGKMSFALQQVDAVDGRKLSVRATPGKRADGPAHRPVETGGKKIKDIAAAQGTEYIAYLDGEQTVSVKK
jgi:serine/threonine-protein kinase